MAKVIILLKPGKSPEVRRTATGWRPISLLNTIGKIIKAVVGERLAEAAEEARILPEGQVGNRKNRSTKLAIYIVTKAVRTA